MSDTPATPATPSQVTLPGAWPIAIVVLSAVFVQLLDVSIVVVAAPDVQRTLGASYGSVQLVLSGYQVGFAACLILAARLGDVFGRRTLFLIGMAAFTATSLLCATAGSIEVLIASRVVQGISSALMFSQVLTVIQLAFAPEERGGPLGAYGATIGLGTILGPLAGGLLIEAGLFDDAWRAVFFVNVPICLVALRRAAIRCSVTTVVRRLLAILASAPLRLALLIAHRLARNAVPDVRLDVADLGGPVATAGSLVALIGALGFHGRRRTRASASPRPSSSRGERTAAPLPTRDQRTPPQLLHALRLADTRVMPMALRSPCSCRLQRCRRRTTSPRSAAR